MGGSIPDSAVAPCVAPAHHVEQMLALYCGRGLFSASQWLHQTPSLFTTPFAMKHVTLAAALIAGLFSSSSALGQLAFGGTPPGMTKAGLSISKAPVVIMPAVDVQALLAEDAVRDASGVKGPFRFG